MANPNQMQGNQQQPNQNQQTPQTSLNFNKDFYNQLEKKEKKQYLGEIIYPFV